jgi:hypothetical protein
MKVGFFLLIFFFALCKGDKLYKTKVEINRIEIVQYNEKNQPQVVDVEISYVDCPGSQIEILRGNRELAECVLENYKKTDQVEAEIHWYWNQLGYYQWDVTQLGACKRWKDTLDETSYEMIEECEDFIVYGVKVGFVCKRIPTKNLLKACPWFRRE